MKKILILGGTGYIGFNLVKFLIKKNWTVTVLSLKKPKKKRHIKKVKYIKCDISKKRDVFKKIKGEFSHVVNLSGYVDHVNKKKTYNTHYKGVKNLYSFFSSRKYDLKLFLQIGSSAEYGPAKSPHTKKTKCNPKLIYGKSKLMATNFLLNKFKKKKFPVCVFRFYQIFGPYQDINRFIPIVINACKKNKSFPCSDGLQYRDFLYINDAIQAITKSLNNKEVVGKIINVCSGKPVQLKKIINFIKNKIGGGIPLFGKINLRKDEPIIIYSKNSSAKKLLNWKIKNSFYNNLAKTIKNY